MKKKVYMMMSLVLSLVMLSACSSSEDEIDLETVRKAQAHLIGKWRNIANLESQNDPSTEFVEFCENGIAILEFGVGTDEYRIVESTFVFEDNWSFSNGVFWGIHGNIQLSRGIFSDDSQRLHCLIIDDDRLLLSSDGKELKDYIRVD